MACKMAGWSSVYRASVMRLTDCMSELRRRRRGRLVVEELGDPPAYRHEGERDHPGVVVAVDGGEVVRDHEEDERHAHVRVVLAAQAGQRSDRRIGRGRGALDAGDDLALTGPDAHPHVHPHDSTEGGAGVD